MLPRQRGSTPELRTRDPVKSHGTIRRHVPTTRSCSAYSLSCGSVAIRSPADLSQEVVSPGPALCTESRINYRNRICDLRTAGDSARSGATSKTTVSISLRRSGSQGFPDRRDDYNLARTMRAQPEMRFQAVRAKTSTGQEDSRQAEKARARAHLAAEHRIDAKTASNGHEPGSRWTQREAPCCRYPTGLWLSTR